ncbi:MAG: hypothetical protein KGH54_04700 [Candidatus Micrarchaeota archaeon]|nr:hypothetical protein [Candidatus Micrarchaeota archaeon]
MAKSEAIVGRNQFFALSRKATELASQSGDEQELRIKMMVTELKLLELLYRKVDRITGRITMPDIYRALLRDDGSVRIGVVKAGEREVNSDLFLKLRDERQERIEQVYRKAFEYALTVLEGRQVNSFLKHSKKLASQSPSRYIPTVARITLSLSKGADESEVFLEPEAIASFVEGLQSIPSAGREEIRGILVKAYECAREENAKNRLDRMLDKNALFWGRITRHGPKEVSFKAQMNDRREAHDIAGPP